MTGDKCEKDKNHMCRTESCAYCKAGHCKHEYMCAEVGLIPIGLRCQTDVSCVSGSCTPAGFCQCFENWQCPRGSKCNRNPFWANTCTCNQQDTSCPPGLMCFQNAYGEVAECWGPKLFPEKFNCYNYLIASPDDRVCPEGKKCMKNRCKEPKIDRKK
eukprot:TRINITY_DN7417_c0_g1_i5.p1 TRINITY_DN7417_c0_g1~~TRINITY_DN7417_c0_g1_i5.p1  ORF type:complete len:158 (+),score=14.82 TRINITY_DN7417_c0_g1_i5:74-547(+)